MSSRSSVTVTPSSRNCSCCAASAGDRPICLQPRLIEHEVQRGGRPGIVAVHLAHVRVGAHHRFDVGGDGAQPVEVRSADAVGHGNGTGGPNSSCVARTRASGAKPPATRSRSAA
jgi:hypothetical protein